MRFSLSAMNAAYIIEPEGGLPTVDSVIDAIMVWASAEGKKVSFVAYEPMLVDVDGQRFRVEKSDPPRAFFGAAPIDGFLAGVKYKVLKLWAVD